MSSNIEDTKRTVERLHNCKATCLEDIVVVERFGGGTVWKGIVHVFKIEGHHQTNKCYAWSSPIEGSTKRRFYAVLHVPPIDSAAKAVIASIEKDPKTDE